MTDEEVAKIYNAALEAAAREAEGTPFYENLSGDNHVPQHNWNDSSDYGQARRDVAAAIRALPVPQDVGSFHIRQKVNPTADVIARGIKELEDENMMMVPREPTTAMQDVMLEAIKDGITINDDVHRSMRHVYRDMIEAAGGKL